jgi:hypothetical protein
MRAVLMTGLMLQGLVLAAHVPTGPEVGAAIPAFEVSDLNGRPQTLATLTGPKGLMLVFFRSADW